MLHLARVLSVLPDCLELYVARLEATSQLPHSTWAQSQTAHGRHCGEQTLFAQRQPGPQRSGEGDVACSLLDEGLPTVVAIPRGPRDTTVRLLRTSRSRRSILGCGRGPVVGIVLGLRSPSFGSHSVTGIRPIGRQREKSLGGDVNGEGKKKGTAANGRPERRQPEDRNGRDPVPSASDRERQRVDAIEEF